MLDSLVRVSRRVAYGHYASILAEARSSVPAGGIDAAGYNTPRREPRSRGLCPTAQTDAGLTAGECTGGKPADHPRASLVASASLSTISRTV